MPVVVPARPWLLPLGRAWGGRALGCDGCCGVGGCCCSAPACRARTCPGGAELSSGPAAAPAWSCQCRVWLPKVLRTELVPGSLALPKHPRVLGEAAAGAGCGGRVLVPPLGGTLCWLKQGAAGTRILGMLTSRRPLPLLPPSSPFPTAAAPSSGSHQLGSSCSPHFPAGGSRGGCPAVPRSPAGLAAGISRRVPILTPMRRPPRGTSGPPLVHLQRVLCSPLGTPRPLVQPPGAFPPQFYPGLRVEGGGASATDPRSWMSAPGSSRAPWPGGLRGGGRILP